MRCVLKTPEYERYQSYSMPARILSLVLAAAFCGAIWLRLSSTALAALATLTLIAAIVGWSFELLELRFDSRRFEYVRGIVGIRVWRSAGSFSDIESVSAQPLRLEMERDSARLGSPTAWNVILAIGTHPRSILTLAAHDTRLEAQSHAADLAGRLGIPVGASYGVNPASPE